MTGLSWFIYSMEVIDNLRGCLLALFVAGVIAAIITGVQFLVRTEAFDSARAGWDERNESIKQDTLSFAKKLAAVMAVLMALLTIIPSKSTLTLIAASEVGDKVLQSEQVKGVVNPGIDLLKTWLKRETERLQKEATESK